MASLPTLFYERSSRDPSQYGLPTDLLERARKRIRVLAFLILFASGLDLLIAIGQRLVVALGGAGSIEQTNGISLAGNLVTLTACALMAALSMSARVSSPQLLRVALGFEVLLCATISVTTPLVFFEDQGALPQLTWVTPLIILFPLLVPLPPRTTLLTATIAAATRPLGLWLLGSLGRIECHPDDYFTASFSPAVGVVMAYFGARVVHGLGLEVAEARRMGSYRLEKLLGKGGMGEVWLARHRFLARPAAVKLIRPEVLGDSRRQIPESARDRFEREAQATALMCSPHTIRLYDYGVTETGTLYYVMELLDGYDLELLVERFGPLPAARAISLLVQICHSLAEAHEAGLIHRDIKPANIYVCRYGREVDFIKVLDFGLVKAWRNEPEIGLTGEHTIAGTPAYFSPEQASGAHPGDVRSDLYAVGCVAYWLLTGELVFSATTPLAMIAKHAGEVPVPPSRRVDAPIPEALDRLVMQCLEKDPADRPQSALDLSFALSRCEVDGLWIEEHARSWWAIHHPSEMTTSPESTAPGIQKGVL